MGRSDKLAIEYLREWDFHNNKHHCYYLESNDSGVDECPGDFPTLRAFLESREFPVESVIGRFFGRDLDEPNSRSRISGKENPVSIAELRRRGNLRANKGVHYRESTDEVLRNRAQKATGQPVENEQAAWQVEAMEYFKERLDEIHESMVRAFSGVMAQGSRHETLLSDLLTSVNALEEKITERSEVGVAVEPKIVVTLENVPTDVAEELQAELSTRVQRIMARRKA